MTKALEFFWLIMQIVTNFMYPRYEHNSLEGAQTIYDYGTQRVANSQAQTTSPGPSDHAGSDGQCALPRELAIHRELALRRELTLPLELVLCRELTL